MFFGVIGRRFFHSSRVYLTASKSSALGTLRKSTGYSISNCKKAVELFPEDIPKAEEWLHAEAKKQGWAKWAKIQARSATQGLVGVYCDETKAVMVEVNCETDFVARNVEFQQLVGKILSSCMQHVNPDCNDKRDLLRKSVLNETELKEIPHGPSTLGELINSAITKFSEKTVVKRAVVVEKDCIDAVTLCSLSHPSVPCPNLEGATLGKYGTLLSYKGDFGSLPMKDEDTENDCSLVGVNVCQHIIGMNPSSIGELSDKDIQNFLKATGEAGTSNIQAGDENTKIEDSSVADAEQNTEQTDAETEGLESVVLKDTDETRLLFQPYLYDSNITVGEALYHNSLVVLGFERFECGENLVENGEEAQAASVAV